MKLQDFLNNMEAEAVKSGGLKITLVEAWTKGLCASCVKPAIDNCYSDAGRKEYYISGLCERCFDAACKE